MYGPIGTALALAVGSAAVAQPISQGLRLDDLHIIAPTSGVPSTDGSMIFHDILTLGLEGQGWANNAHPYDRLPAKAEGVVREPVWALGHHSAGLCVRFVTDARTMAARWALRSASLDMNHMPATGVSGLDLYARGADGWHWVGVGRPDAQTNEAVLASGLDEGPREFLLYLPLYNGVERVELGLPQDATLAKAPAYPEVTRKPIVFWGTSITQGGCASRPGMAHTAILGRWLERRVINLGFSGNGQLEPEMAELLAEIDAAVYVLDCLPNLSAELVAERAVPAVRIIRSARPDVPIVLVENITYQQAALSAGAKLSGDSRNDALRKAYGELLQAGVTGLHYVAGGALLGVDGEATVDGTHPTDLGFLRMAEALLPALRSALAPDPDKSG